jgi:hypothetical protein
MTVRHLTRDAEEPAGRLFAGLAGSLEGVSDRRAPLILLHGLTFDQLRGPGFLAVWEMVEAGMHIGLLPQAAQELLRSARNLRQELLANQP